MLRQYNNLRFIISKRQPVELAVHSQDEEKKN